VVISIQRSAPHAAPGIGRKLRADCRSLLCACVAIAWPHHPDCFGTVVPRNDRAGVHRNDRGGVALEHCLGPDGSGNYIFVT